MALDYIIIQKTGIEH